MAERKPPGMSFESWIEKQIREAEERGEFDNLPGAGKPLSNLDRPWLTTYAEREGLSLEAALPEPLLLRKEVERLPDTVAGLRTEDEVRRTAHELNLRIARWIRSGVGPRVHVAPVDVDEVVADWKAARPTPVRPERTPDVPRPSEPRARWWRRRRRRS